MDRLPEGTILVDAEHYRRMAEELALYKLRCEKQTARIEVLKKNLIALKGGK